MAKRKKQTTSPVNLQPKGLQTGFSTNLDTNTLPLPVHPLAEFKFDRPAVQGRI